MIRVGFIPGRAPSGTMNLAADAVWRCRKLLRESGVDLVVDSESDVDILWAHWKYLKAERSHLLTCGIPVIVDEERDSAQVSPGVRKASNEHDSVVGIVKPFLCRDRSYYSRKQWATGYYHDFLQAVCPDIYGKEPKSPGPDFDTSLLHLSASYGTFHRLDSLKAMPLPDTDRSIDVHFRGWVNYKPCVEGTHDRTPPTTHRRMCVDAIKSLEGVSTVMSAGRDVPLPIYWLELFDSKICVSPWGWGEACHRDYEAILCGCRMIKPLSEHITAFPDIYDPSPWYAVCKPDFSDLHSVVEHELAQWGKNAQIRDGLREVLIAESRPEKVAAHIAAVIHKCLERAK